MSVSRNGVYKIYDHMHVAFPRIIPRIMPPNHTRESYLRNIPPDQQGRAKHTPKHTPETYLRNIPRIIPPDATRFAGHGVFGKGHMGKINISWRGPGKTSTAAAREDERVSIGET